MAGAASDEEAGPPERAGMAVASAAAVAVALVVASAAVASRVEAVVSAEVEAAAPGKRFKRIDISALGFRVYLSYFCASLKTVHEKR